MSNRIGKNSPEIGVEGERRERYQLKKLGSNIRVVDLKEDRVVGYWDQEEKYWFDVQNFIGGESHE